MFTIVAFNHTDGAGGAGTTTTLDPVDAEPDPHVTASGDNITIPSGLNKLLAFWGFTGSLTATETAVLSRIVLHAPSMGNIDQECALVQAPAAAAADDEEPDSPTPLEIWLDRPRVLTPGEALQMHVAESVAGDDRQATGIVFLGDGNLNVPNGPILTVRATAAITCVAYNWVNGNLTFTDNLEVGMYAVVGMRVESASGIAARLVGLTGVGKARPGCIAYDTREDIENKIFRCGGMGVWGTFHSTEPPTLDIFARTTDSAQTVFLDLIKLG